MSGWIKVEKSLENDPRVLRMASRLRNAGVTQSYSSLIVIGALVRLWCYADTHLRKDDTLDLGPEEVDELVGVSGFSETCPPEWLEVIDNETVKLPSYQEHNGTEARRRAMTQQRVAKHRAQKQPQQTKAEKEGHRAAVPRPVRRKVLERDGHACVYCGRKAGENSPPNITKRDAQLTLDHVIPLSRGGENVPNNMVTACRACNVYKSDRTPEEAGLDWPTDPNGKRYGSVTKSLPDQDQDQDHTKKDIGHLTKPNDPERFDEFWSIYPKKVKKKPTWTKWKSKGLDRIADQIIEDVRARAERDRRWREGFIPDPLTYINQERWEDEIDDRADGRPGSPKSAVERNREGSERFLRQRGYVE